MSRQEELTQLQADIINKLATDRLTTKEIAALLTVIMQNMLVQDTNKSVLAGIGIDTDDLTIEQVTLLQRLLAEEYYKEMIDDGQQDS